MKCVSAIAITLCIASAARADDLSDRLDREIARLASDDPSVRDAAVEAIEAESCEARAAVAKRIESEKDAEVRARLQVALESLERKAIRKQVWTPVWTVQPLANAHATSAAISRDGRKIATGGPDQRVRILDAATLAVEREIDAGFEPGAAGLAFTPDGEALVGASRSCGVRAWKCADGSQIEKFDGCEGHADWCRWTSPGGVGALVRDGSIGAVTDGKAWWQPIEEPYFAVAANGDRYATLSGSAERVVISMFRENQPPVVTARATGRGTGWFHVVAVNAGVTAAALVRDGACEEFSLETGKTLRKYGTDLAGIRALPDGGWLTWTEAGLLQWWDDRKETRGVKGNPIPDAIVEIAGDLLVINSRGESGRDVAVRSSATGEAIYAVKSAHQFGPWPGGAVAIEVDGVVRIVTAGQSPIAVPVRPDRPSTWLNALQAGSTLVLPARSGSFAIDLTTGIETGPLPFHRANVTGLQWRPQGIIVTGAGETAVLSPDGTETSHRDDALWAAGRGGEDLSLLGMPPEAPRWGTPDGGTFAWLADGAICAQAGQDAIRKLALAEADAAEIKPGAVSLGKLALSADGKRLACFGPTCRSVEEWDLDTDRLLWRRDLDFRDTRFLEFAADDRTLIVVDDDNETIIRRSVRVLDPAGAVVADWIWAGHDFGRGFVKGRRWVLGRTDRGLQVGDVLHPASTLSFPEPNPEGGLTALLAAPDQDFVLFRAERTTPLLNLADGTCRDLELDAPVLGAVLLPGGNAAILTASGLSILRAKSWDLVTTREDLYGSAIAASPDGRRIAIARGSRVILYEPR